MGKGKKPGEGEGADHISRPLATLKDPSSLARLRGMSTIMAGLLFPTRLPLTLVESGLLCHRLRLKVPIGKSKDLHRKR